MWFRRQIVLNILAIEITARNMPILAQQKIQEKKTRKDRLLPLKIMAATGFASAIAKNIHKLVPAKIFCGQLGRLFLKTPHPEKK